MGSTVAGLRMGQGHSCGDNVENSSEDGDGTGMTGLRTVGDGDKWLIFLLA